MKVINTLAFALITLSIQAQEGKINRVEIQTSAVCEMCKDRIEYDLAFEKGIKFADLNLENKILTVEYKTGKTSVETIKKRIAKIGYTADEIHRIPISYENLPACCKDGAHDDEGHHEEQH
ncbi:MAG: heavy metal-associated domain-containing protein [Bacteroidota bacterium]